MLCFVKKILSKAPHTTTIRNDIIFPEGSSHFSDEFFVFFCSHFCADCEVDGGCGGSHSRYESKDGDNCVSQLLPCCKRTHKTTVKKPHIDRKSCVSVRKSVFLFFLYSQHQKRASSTIFHLFHLTRHHLIGMMRFSPTLCDAVFIHRHTHEKSCDCEKKKKKKRRKIIFRSSFRSEATRDEDEYHQQFNSFSIPRYE